MNDRLPLSWTRVCPLDDIVPNTGVCALVNGEQVAVFHVAHAEAGGVFAIDNVDPVSQAAVMSRGLIGSLGERIVRRVAVVQAAFRSADRRMPRSTRQIGERLSVAGRGRFRVDRRLNVTEHA